MIQSYLYTYIYWIRHGDSTRWADETGLTSQFFSPLHYSPSPWKAVPHHRGLRPLLFTNSSVSSFKSHKNQTRERAVRRGLRSYPTRLECLTFVDVTTKAAHTLSYFKALGVGLAGDWTRDLPLGRPALIQLNEPGGTITKADRLYFVAGFFLFRKSIRFCACHSFLQIFIKDCRLIFVISFVLRTFSRKKVTRHESFT